MIYSVGMIAARLAIRPEYLDVICGAAAKLIDDFEAPTISQVLLGIEKAGKADRGLLGPNAGALAGALLQHQMM